ncbi:MAG TPA: deoxyhypusine synthase [Candidatus Thermoplasmatota archaeon]|nr:deoxyhypusine synthase [Candidatus Thermoplasmatota archaeon]
MPARAPEPQPDPVRDLRIQGSTTLAELMAQFGRTGGFTAAKLAMAAQITERMLRDRDCLRILSFPAAIISTGTRGVVRDMVAQGAVDAIITTCGTLDHDLARVWRDYYIGTFEMDDAELRHRGVHRLGSVLVPETSYGLILEEKLRPILEQLHKQKQRWGPRELCRELGLALASEPERDASILWHAAQRGVPVFVPGITDGAVGSQLWLFTQRHRDFTVDVLRDEQDLSDLVHTKPKLGALMLGGGISKHHTIWWAQFRDGLDYAVYITTAQESDGSLSGARTREAISWGKLKEHGAHVTVEGDVTVLLPLLWGAVAGAGPGAGR